MNSPDAVLVGDDQTQMTILIRQKGDVWRAAAEVSYPHEADLQLMLSEFPNVIPVRGGEKVPAAFIREAGLPGSGNTDLLGADVEGHIYIVECKLASNSEIRRNGSEGDSAHCAKFRQEDHSSSTVAEVRIPISQRQ